MSERLSVVLGENKKEIALPDGKRYVLSPLTLGDIALAEDYFGCDMEGFVQAIKKLKNILYLVCLSVKKTNPTVTPELIGGLFGASDMDGLNQVIGAIFEISGMSEKNAVGATGPKA